MTFKELAKAIRLPLSRRQSTGSWEWNGRSLALLESPGRERDTRTLIHDMSHWLTSTPRRRARNEFGLGSSVGPSNAARRFISADDAQREEEAVCILSCIIERLLKFEKDGPDGPFGYYSMDHAFSKTLTCWRLLKSRGVFEVLGGSFSRDEIRGQSAWVLKKCRDYMRPRDG